MHQLLELCLPDLSILMLFDAISALDNQHIDIATLRYLGRLQVPVLLSGVIPSVQNLDPINFYQEHGGPQHVACAVSCELDPLLFALLVVIDSEDTLGGGGHVLRVEELLVGRDASHSHEVLGDVFVDRLGWVSHEHLPFEACFLREVGETGAVVDVEMSQE